MKLSVVVLTWNNIATIQSILDVLHKDFVDIEREIIVVDNGSTDGCQEFATIKNEKNLGVSRGKNQGIEAAKGQYVVILDGDIVPVPNSINCLLDYVEAHPDVKALGFPPNKFAREHNKDGQKHHEDYCFQLHDVKICSSSIAYYGIFHRSIFDAGVRLITGGPFDGVGYGWEERDLYMQMQMRSIKQWVAGINHAAGKYYHDINSSICSMGHDVYMRTSRERAEYFKEKWKEYLINT